MTVDLMIVNTLPDDSTYVNMFLVTSPTAQADTCCPPLLTEVLGEAEATEFAVALKALADPVRLRIVSIIANSPGGEVCTCDLPALLDRTQPTISHHLSLLVKAGVLTREQRGKWAWFHLDRERLASIAAAIGLNC